jgi:hypothetical protein
MLLLINGFALGPGWVVLLVAIAGAIGYCIGVME